MDTRAIVQGFYEGLAAKDGRWQDGLADDVSFSDASGRLRAEGRDAFIQSFRGFLRAVS